MPFCGTTWCAIRVRVRSCELNLKRDVANGEQNSITPTPGALRVTFFSVAHRRMKAILAEFRFDLVIRPWMDFSHLLLAKRENQPINVQSTLVGQTRSKKRNPPQLDLHSHTLKHTHTSYHRCRYSDVWCDGDAVMVALIAILLLGLASICFRIKAHNPTPFIRSDFFRHRSRA